MVKYQDQRIGIFVDVANMYHSAKNLYGARLNFKEVLKVAVANRRLIRAIAYVIKSNSSEEQGFFDALEKSGFEVKYKDLQVYASGAKKADWDVGMAVDAVKLADKLDTVVLVTGDGDFIPLVIYLKEKYGCKVEVISFGRTTSGKLLETVDDFINLDSDKKFLLNTK
ncbi:MAG: NYN domain-containing protein [Patescibacteria group bacterium]|nr:NYN domain-containing protein [Patescibacteria group bacterium]